MKSKVVIAFGMRKPSVVKFRTMSAGPGVDIVGPFVQRFLVKRGRVLIVGISTFGFVVLCAIQQLRRTARQTQTFFVFQIAANRCLKIDNAGVAICRISFHGAQRDIDQFAFETRIANHILTDNFDDMQRFFPRVHAARFGKVVRWQSRDDFEQDRAQQVNVAVCADFSHRPGDQFRSHVDRRTGTGSGAIGDFVLLLKSTGGDCQAPVENEHFSECAQHHVFGFQVAINDAIVMCEGHRVTDGHKHIQVFVQVHFLKSFVPRFSADPLHGIEQRAIFHAAHVVNGHNIGVDQVGSDDGFGQKQVTLRLV